MIKKEILSDNANITTNSKQLEILKQNFPNCFDKNGAFIPHKMAEIVGVNDLDLSRESYSLNWLGKSYARLLANENPQTLIKEDKEHNALDVNCESQNLLIKGDNLEVLKHLKNAYSEKIKMIYIDPPYNTGNDGFVYNDDRKFTPEQLVTLAGIEPGEAKRILDFTASKSNSHSAWLTFMYPRLYVARELLREDGVIFISIDENEVAQLKMLCDEVFGEENFVANLPTVMNLKGNNDEFGFAGTHEYTFVYAKRKENLKLLELKIDEDELEDWEEDEYGVFKQGANLKATGTNAPREKRPNLYFPIFIDTENKIFITNDDKPPFEFSGEIKTLHPITNNQEMSWRWSKTKFLNETHNIIISRNGTIGIYKKQRPSLGDLPSKKPKTLFYKPEYSSGNGTAQIKELFNNKFFSNPKPLALINDFIEIGTCQNDLILDFFAGSGTTAHAVMALNVEDGGNRRFISVQIAEPTDQKSEACKAGYETIFDITKARIEKAAAKIKSDKPDYEGDLGFKIFETIPLFDGYLDEMENLDDGLELYDGSKLNEEELSYLLTTWKTYDGIVLTEDLHPIKFADYQAYSYEKTVYFMEKNFNSEALSAFIKALDEDTTFQPSKLVLFGYNFQSKFLRETAEGLKSYKNKKSIELDVVVRY